MTPAAPVHYKIAAEPAELRQIHRLNYRTFVTEIPQHEGNPEERLVDRFDAENTYVVALKGEAVVGMIAVRGRRPFSLDGKLPDLEAHLPPADAICEIRLLSVDPAHRAGAVFRGLVECLARHCLDEGYDLAVISGTERQLKLYRHIGFVPFGPLVGTPGALFQPMYLTLETFRERGTAFTARRRGAAPVSFLPGPVELAPEVRTALEAGPTSHRSAAFAAELAGARSDLAALTGAPRAQLLLGSGTLANDAVAAQLSLRDARGVVLSNGEFGERLVDHASRWGLRFTALRRAWGSGFEPGEVAALLDREPDVSWLWAVHCETSSGVLNDLAALREICAARGVLLYLDCISSLGTVPVDLRGVEMATGVSGKGLGATAGIALVLHHAPIPPSPCLPRYLDLGTYGSGDGVPFTQSFPLVRALGAALRRLSARQDPFSAIERDARRLRERLRDAGFRVLVDDALASPAVTTLVVPAPVSSAALGARLEEAGYLVSYGSEYLLARGWVQICLMGAYRSDRIGPLVGALRRLASGGAEV